MSRSERARSAVGRRAFALALAAATLAGCAVVAPPTPSAPPAAPPGSLDSLGSPAAPRATDAAREWSGRFAISRTSADPGARQEAAAGRFELAAVPMPGGRRLELALTSPFGQTVATGRREPDGGSTLRLADGRTLRAATLDGLVERALGAPLPVERLPDWLDDRFETVLERDPQGRPTLAADSGWRIEREPLRWALQRAHADGTLRVVLQLDR
jgi:outer membrane lipoprotein LolB